MNVLCVVQARVQSTRLPNKILLPILGETLLYRQMERMLASSRVDQFVVATTTEPSDDTVVELARTKGWECFRGHPTDCLDRHYQAAREFGANVIVKIPSDCPLIDPRIIDRVLGHWNKRELDYLSNLHPATYPDGCDVEVMRFEALETAWKEARRELEREHTTPFLWENRDRFQIENLPWESGLNYSMSHRWTIDYAEDYEMIRRVYEELYPKDPLFDINQILALLKEKPKIHEINSKYAGVNWYRHHLDELKTIGSEETRHEV